MYRPPASPPVGEWARFLDRMHAARGWSLQQAFKELHPGLRLSENSRASYDALVKGKRQPKQHEREYLVKKFGDGPNDEDRSGVASLPAPDLAAALMALAGELKAMREERAAWESGVIRTLRTYLPEGQVPEGAGPYKMFRIGLKVIGVKAA